MKEVELAIVAEGPAGMAAAIEAAKLNVKVALIVENAKLGGKICQGDQGEKVEGSYNE